MAFRRGIRVFILLSLCLYLSFSWARAKWGLPSPFQFDTFDVHSPRQNPFDNSASAGIAETLGTTSVVVAALKKDDVRWIDGLKLGWEVWKYEAGGEDVVGLRIPKNQGAEAMAYLTHIIDQYDNLTSRIIFLHPKQYQWHNDDPRYDGKRVLQNLQLAYIDKVGYTSLRCHWSQGCPSAFTLTEKSTPPSNLPPDEHMSYVSHLYSTAFPKFFPSLPFPEKIGAPCCAQFAVSRDAVLRNTKETYVRIRDWLIQSNEADFYTGRVLEYTWHILFGKQAVNCPSADDCYCKLYGVCGLSCSNDGDCGRYTYLW